MLLIDVNLLVYASSTESPQHPRASRWLREQLERSRRIGIPWESAIGFVRVVSNPRLFARPASVSAAWTVAHAWLEHPNVWIPLPTDAHLEFVTDLMRPELGANDIHDVHLAALAISHGLKLATHDHGFGRFEGLRWFDPIAS